MKHLYAGTPPSEGDQIRYHAEFIQNSTDRDQRNKLHLLILVLLQILGYYHDIGAIVFNLELFFFALFQVECKKTVFLDLQQTSSIAAQFNFPNCIAQPLSKSTVYKIFFKIHFAYFSMCNNTQQNNYLAQFFIPDTMDRVDGPWW